MREEMRGGEFHTAEFGRRVRLCRKQAGMTQRDVATALGVSDGTVSSWEQATREPSVATIWALAGVFGVSPEAFFPVADAPPTEPAHVRLDRLERVVGQIRREVDDAHAELRRDGMLA